MRSLWQWFRSNLTSLILALLLGLTVWLIVNQEQNPVQEADLSGSVPIALSGLQPGLVITSDIPQTARIRLRAQRSTWQSITTDDVLVTGDLSQYGPGTYQIPLQVSIRAQAILVSSTPANIRVTIEEQKERELPIQIHLDGKPATGYSAGEPTIDPHSVTVNGPRSAVELISEIRATPPVEGLRDNFEATLPLVALDSRGNPIRNVQISPVEAEVTIPITQEAGFRDIAVVARTVGQPDPGYYVIGIRVIPDLITVRGDPPIIDAMLPYAETEPIDLNGLTDNLVREVKLNLPAGVTPVDAGPIQAFITIEALQGSRSLNVPIQAVGLGAGLSADFSPTTVVVIVAGPLPVLNQLISTQDVIITVDVTNLKPGVYQIQPKVQSTHSDITIESVFPAVISVTIIQSGPP